MIEVLEHRCKPSLITVVGWAGHITGLKSLIRKSPYLAKLAMMFELSEIVHLTFEPAKLSWSLILPYKPHIGSFLLH